MIETKTDAREFLHKLYGDRNPSETKMLEPIDPHVLRAAIDFATGAAFLVAEEQIVEGFIVPTGESVTELDQVRKLARLFEGRLPWYTWPGGYGMLYLSSDGVKLCPQCAQKLLDQEEVTHKLYPVAWAADWDGERIRCNRCNDTIDSLSDIYDF